MHVDFTIIDTGWGIAARVLPALFQPFPQADSSTARCYGGTGLGLVIAREPFALVGDRVGLNSHEAHAMTMGFAIIFEKKARVKVAAFRVEEEAASNTSPT